MAPPELYMRCIGLCTAPSPSRFLGVLSARTGSGCDLNIHVGCPFNQHPGTCQSLLISSQPMPPICVLMCAVLSGDSV